MPGRAWLVLPTYDEAESLEPLIRAACDALGRATGPAGFHVLVVDDASPDGTGAIADRLARELAGAVSVLHRPAKLGLGSAYVAGFSDALARGADVLLEMDADFSHDPADLPRLVAHARAGADLVLGSRYVRGGAVRNWSAGRRVVSRLGCLYAQAVLWVPVRDLTGGLKCFRADALRAIGYESVRSAGYAFQIELTHRALTRGLRVVEVPITFSERREGHSKMSGRIALEAVGLVPRLRLAGRRAHLVSAPVPPPCGICSGALVLLYAGSGGEPSAADMSPTCHTPGAHADLFRCRRCGTVQQPVLPRGGELVDLYREMRDDAYLDEEPGRRATARRLLERLESHVPAPGSLLEVGCGHGLLLDEARARGWRTTGLEPAAAGRAHARDVLSLDVRDGTLEDLDPVTAGGFDAVVMVDVLEHLGDPVGALRACRSLLAESGVLVVVTPDPSSVAARLTRSRWWGYLPAHTFLVPRGTLRGLLTDQGFERLAEATLRRTFTLGYWMGGLAERGALARGLERLMRLGVARRPVTLSLGDEWVVLARRGVAVSRAAPAGASAARVAQPTGA